MVLKGRLSSRETVIGLDEETLWTWLMVFVSASVMVTG